MPDAVVFASPGKINFSSDSTGSDGMECIGEKLGSGLTGFSPGESGPLTAAVEFLAVILVTSCPGISTSGSGSFTAPAALLSALDRGMTVSPVWLEISLPGDVMGCENSTAF